MDRNDRTLLERLADSVASPARRRRPFTRARLEHSICAHLRRLFNSHRGVAPAATGYGMPDLVHLASGFTGDVRRFAREVEELIERYEERLCDVLVTRTSDDEDDPLCLRLSIRAGLVGAPGEKVRFRATVDPDRTVHVTPGG